MADSNGIGGRENWGGEKIVKICFKHKQNFIKDKKAGRVDMLMRIFIYVQKS